MKERTKKIMKNPARTIETDVSSLRRLELHLRLRKYFGNILTYKCELDELLSARVVNEEKYTREMHSQALVKFCIT